MKCIIRYQNGVERAFPVGIGYTYLTGSFGVHIFDNKDGSFTARFGNGYVGREPVGGWFYDRIILELDGTTQPHVLPRIGHYAEWGDGPERIGFGTGASYFPPNAVKILRWTQKANVAVLYGKRQKLRRHPLLALPLSLVENNTKAVYEAKAHAMMAALQTGTTNTSVGLLSQCGDWMPLGDPIPNAQGGEGINPYPGWEQSSAYHLLSHDLCSERMPIDYRDAFTGEPKRAAAQPVYRATRGWTAWTTHDEFVQRNPHSTNPDARIPRDVNEGTSWYRDRLLSYMAHDDQHLVRATQYAKAAWFLWGDACALEDLKMIAADAYMGFNKEDRPDADHVGSGFGRGAAWTLDALVAANYSTSIFEPEVTSLVELFKSVQMPNGAWYRAESKYENQLGFSPSPWKDLGMPREYDAAQTMETCFMGCAMANAQATREALEAWSRIFFAQPRIGKWMAVGINGKPTTNYQSPVGVDENFWTWPLAGVLKTTDGMESLVPPGGNGVPAGADVKKALLAAGNYQATAKALEALE